MITLNDNLKSVFGQDAKFRDSHQEEAVKGVINKKRLLVVQKTGWGKSLVYFLATKILRQRGEGATIIISPLLSLARNQIDSTKQYGLVSETINSSNNSKFSEREELVRKCNSGECDVLFITPEQLQKEEFIQLLGQLKVALFVVDEAHCISDWGHDFRPDYRRIKQLLNSLPSNVGVLATTATANNRVINDISNQIGDCEIIRGPLLRESLNLHKVYLPNLEEKYAWILKNINNLPGSGIIYATTIKECKRLTEWLKFNKIEAHEYHSNLNDKEKVQLEQKLIKNELKVLVCTIALGMGFDKNDIGFVIHYYTPKSLIEYYQQIGRAGRNIPESYCILLYGGQEERKINDHFIFNSFPKERDILSVMKCIESTPGIKEREIAEQINVKTTVLSQILKLLLIDGYIAKDNGEYYETLKPFKYQKKYYESIIKDKQKDFKDLLCYQEEDGCLMNYVTTLLDDPIKKPCGKCSNCMDVWKITNDNVSENQKQDVQNYLENEFIMIEPRKKSSITNKNLEFVHSPGITLSHYHEELGQEASRGKYKDNVFSEILVKASAKKLKAFFRSIGLSNDIVIVPIPSNRRPRLVSKFAFELSKELNVQYADILKKVENEPEQKNALNNQRQEKNIREFLYIENNLDLNNKNIILVDDFVDSKWTFTIAAELIGVRYQNTKVIPFAISSTSGSD